MARRGTELFPELGAHCDEADCNQLDFLPFECDGSGGFFCAAHRTYREHGCAKAADEGRTVVVCPDCGDSIERTAPGQAEREILDEHARSDRCDPARKRKPACPVRRSKEALTFSNRIRCKGCGLEVCLRHRFPRDHACAATASAAAFSAGRAAVGQCGRDAKQKKEGGRRPLAVSARSFKIC
ncbi:zinc finger AN1 domain-containing stress-associated protein 17-like [Panicum miliaceum]|uniref:Zinc finger AN1 domain-containing stress-associated protein 17-like n=1 Tax=Panicum miliaceum TaxID=4540 RepID=A0A3L6QRW4_PANMI|nr:zinc finger AN1 domain-containing stress-associated protein 17-like [Panicum miliaceum]